MKFDKKRINSRPMEIDQNRKICVCDENWPQVFEVWTIFTEVFKSSPQFDFLGGKSNLSSGSFNPSLTWGGLQWLTKPGENLFDLSENGQTAAVDSTSAKNVHSVFFALHPLSESAKKNSPPRSTLLKQETISVKFECTKQPAPFHQVDKRFITHTTKTLTPATAAHWSHNTEQSEVEHKIATWTVICIRWVSANHEFVFF
jgi:hypothetical protein